MARAKKSAGARLPRRYKRGGKEVGSYYWRDGSGKDINLRTSDGDLAIKRAKEARNGKRHFEADNGGAARAVAEAVVGTGSASTPPVVEPAAPAASGLPAGGTPTPPSVPLPPTHTAPPALPPVNGQPAPESPGDAKPGATAVHPDAIFPPPPGWADQVAAAAGTARPDGEGEADEEFDGSITPDMIDEFVNDAANWAVELQIMGQTWLASRGYIVPKVKVQTATVPDDAKGREMGKRIWKRCFQRLLSRWMPGLEIPDWIAAPVLVASFTLPVQFGKGATIIKDADAPEGAPEAASSPTAPADATAAGGTI